MHRAVRRTLAIAGTAGLLCLMPATASTAWAEDPTPAPVSSDAAAGNLDDPAPSGCEENPVICQAGGPINSTTDCGLPSDGDQGIAVGEPNPATPADPDTKTVGIAAADEPTPEDPGPVDPDAVICIASGVGPGGAPQADGSDATGGGGEAVVPVSAGAPQLPRTGPAPLLPTVAVGMWLVLLGLVAALAGRRTARI